MSEKESPIRHKSYEFEKKGFWRDEETGEFFIRSAFTAETADTGGDIITREATEKAVEEWRKWGNIRWLHQPDPVGRVTRIGTADDLDWNVLEAMISSEKAQKLIEDGVVHAMSVGVYPLEYELIPEDEIDYDASPLANKGWFAPIRITDMLLVEVSIVDVPMQELAVFQDKSQMQPFVLHKMMSSELEDVIAQRKALLERKDKQEEAPSPSDVKESAPSEDDETVVPGDERYRKVEEEVLPEAAKEAVVTEDVGDVVPDNNEGKDVATKEKDVETTEDEIALDVDGDAEVEDEVMELSAAVVLDGIEGLDKKLDSLIESTKGIETILSKSADEVEVEPEPVEDEVVDEKALTADDVGKIVREMVKEAMDELAKPLPRESSVIIESEDEDETESIDSVYDRKEIHKRMSEAVGARLGDR